MPISVEGSLFAHLATRFAPRPENLATEALAYVLQRSPAARREMARILRGAQAEFEGDLTFRTQSSGTEETRPDLAARTESGAEVALIEVKFWAGLTARQPVAYLNRLTDRGTLLFVCPSAREDLLWREISRRCAEAKLDLKEQTTSGLRVASMGSRSLALVSWRELLFALRKALEIGGERQLVEDIGQLEGLCARMDAEAFLPIAAEELTSHVYRRVLEFNAIVDSVTASLAETKLVDTSGLRATPGSGYYGRYLRLAGVDAFLACDIRKWMGHASTPLWITVYGTAWSASQPALVADRLQALERERPGTVFGAPEHDFPSVALFVPTGVERDEVIAAVCKQLERVADCVRDLGLQRSTAAAPELDRHGEPEQ